MKNTYITVFECYNSLKIKLFKKIKNCLFCLDKNRQIGSPSRDSSARCQYAVIYKLSTRTEVRVAYYLMNRSKLLSVPATNGVKMSVELSISPHYYLPTKHVRQQSMLMNLSYFMTI